VVSWLRSQGIHKKPRKVGIVETICPQAIAMIPAGAGRAP
jgi:hypothetical protein